MYSALKFLDYLLRHTALKDFEEILTFKGQSKNTLTSHFNIKVYFIIAIVSNLLKLKMKKN